MGLVLPTWSKSASQHKKVGSYLQQQRRAGHLLQAGISQLQQPKFYPIKSSAEVDAFKLVPDPNPMEGKALLAQAHVILAQFKFAEHDRSSTFPTSPTRDPTFNTRSWPPQTHQPWRDSQLLNCFQSPVISTSLPLETNSSAVATAIK